MSNIGYRIIKLQYILNFSENSNHSEYREATNFKLAEIH